jgi:hypothetical protein
MFLF